MEGVFLGNFSDRDSVFNEFDCFPNGVKILFAWYGNGDYCGAAFVLFKKDNKLYEVNGSHCSCNGLEGQWDPELTSVDALRYRMEKGTLGSDSDYSEGNFSDMLESVLRMIERGRA